MGPTDKRELLSRAFAATRFTHILELLPQRPVLMVLTYHRIGDSLSTPYDSGVFSATADELDDHIRHIKKRFHLLTPEETIAMARGAGPTRASVLFTFDDGYLDNYEAAFPVLRSHGVSAMFFLATGFVGSSRVPWWDRMAFVIKQCPTSTIRLRYPQPVEFDVEKLGLLEVSRRILRIYRSPAVTDPERFERELAEACLATPPGNDASPLFMSYEQAREMQAAGQVFGSHTHSHTILSTLSAAAQREEFRASREILERELNTTIDVLAYPVGSTHAFSGQSIEGLKATGYRAAFSHYGGLNRPGEIDPYDIRRLPMDRPSTSRLRLRTAVGGITGTRWF
ncbi:MAG: polysaccharide deacetylase family protein [Vicinamibacterales bacterium]